MTKRDAGLGVLVLAMLGVACGGGTTGPGAGGELFGSATATVTAVPADVACIAITAASGATSVVTQMPVTVGESAVFHLARLPLGSVTFSGAAFPSACTDVTPSSTPSWVSDPDVTATLTPTTTPSITLTMKQNGTATVGVDFPDAGGGAVDAGAGPVALATGRNGPLNLAIDANNVYWTENNTGGVYQVAKAGGPVVTIKAPDGVGNSAWAVATDANGGGSTVYWTDRATGRIGAAPVGGGTAWYYASPKGGGAGSYGIAQGYVNGTDYVYAADFTAGDVWYVDATCRGCTGVQAFTMTRPTGLFDYAGQFLLIALYDTGTVQNSATTIATGTNVDARYVTSDGTTAYWTASDGNQVWYAPVNASGVAPTLLSGSESEPWGIAADGAGSVYWVNKTNGTIRHAHMVAGAWVIDTIATGNNPTDVRVDATAIYWADFGSGRVLRLAK